MVWYKRLQKTKKGKASRLQSTKQQQKQADNPETATVEMMCQPAEARCSFGGGEARPNDKS